MSGQILVVDGLATRRITLKVRLAAACYDTLTARTGAEALAVLERGTSSLVLIGGGPGDMSIADLCARISAVAPRVPLMAMVTPEGRIAALRAGAAAAIATDVDDLDLFARIRGLLREQDDAPGARPGLARDAVSGMAEPQATFDFGTAGSLPSVMLVADTGAAVAWRSALSTRLTARLRVAEPERALAEAAIGLVPDLYVIAAEISAPGDGLRLLSELRARRASRNAAFAVAANPGRVGLGAIALDLGAGDVLPGAFPDADAADEAALRLAVLIRRKQLADMNRRAAEHERALARIDPLTALPNRRFALPRLAGLCGGGRPCSVIALDIDRFKAVNDRHGHAAGDAVLIEVADRLESVVRHAGFVARMGGEEFLAVLPDLTELEAEVIARRMRRAIAEQPVRLGKPGATVTVTVSAGLAGQTHGTAGPGEHRALALLQRADDALLDAKRTGRNRLIVASFDTAA